MAPVSGPPAARIGAAEHLVLAEPLRGWWSPDRLAAAQVRRGFNWPFCEAVRDGVIRLRLPGCPRLEQPMAELLGSADFVGINDQRRNLVAFAPRAPGCVRPTYLRVHAHELVRAVAEGIPAQGCFHWSLLDNCEWTDGDTLRFGLYRVDCPSQRRIAKADAAHIPVMPQASGLPGCGRSPRD